MTVAPSRVTVAVEGWNGDDLGETHFVRDALASLADQSYPIDECEILIMEDAARPSLVRQARGVFPRARMLPVSGLTYYRCKNLAMREAGGDILVFADSDVRYHREWLARMLAAFGPGVELVTGHTRYEPGFLSETLTLCDAGMNRAQDGFTSGFFCHNLAMRRSLFERVCFRDDLGLSGGGGGEILRDLLLAEGVRAWFCHDARAEHPLPPFVQKRLRVGSYHFYARRRCPDLRGARLARVPVLAPLLVMAGILWVTWRRVVGNARRLPGGAAAVPLFFATTAFARAVELIGACACAWAPGLVARRAGWHQVPAESRPADG